MPSPPQIIQWLKHSAERAWPAASLRSYLFAVILLALTPIAAFMCWQIFTEVRREQAQIEDTLSASSSAFATSVERELFSSQEALAVLSHSELLQQERIGTLGRLLHGRPRRDWDSVFVLDRDGTPLLDTGTQRSGQGPDVQRLRNLFQRVAKAGNPIVASLADEEATGPRNVSIAMPVMQAGRLRYVLGARISDATWQRLAMTAGRPEGGRATLFDERQRLIGSSGGEIAAGTPLPGDVQEATAGASTGVRRSQGLDGHAVYAAWTVLPNSGWLARISLPAAGIDAAHRRAIAAALSTSGLSLLVGLLLAALVGRRIATPLRQLAKHGPQGLQGRMPVREVALLRDALARAQTQDALANQQLRETQRIIDLAQETGHVGFMHHDFAQDRMLWSPGLCKLFCLTAPEAAMPMRRWFDLIHPADRERVERELWSACALRHETQTIEYCVSGGEQSPRWLSSRLAFSFDDDGHAVQMTGVTVDMTDHREAELQRAELTERAMEARRTAEAASKAKDEFLTMLSHELRNPLGAISAAVDVLDSADGSSSIAIEARAIIGRQTRNLAHMMNDLLDVGRVIAGKILLARQPVNLRTVVERVEETLAITGDVLSHDLQLELGDAWVHGDSVRLEQVVTNLVINAIKYTPAGRLVHVATRLEGAQAVLTVRDSGAGIPASLLPHVFDLFVQGERPPDRRAGGLGIGLTLVRRLVELQGGTVVAESSDAGSTFTLRMPAIEPPALQEGDTLPPSRQRNVLVVEDNDDVLAALRAKLELDGHTVSTAVDGVEGLSRLLMLKPEVSIVDIGLPGLTGYELARHARAAGYAGRMIALSGYGAERDAQKALVAGFDAYLVKPVDRQQLRASLSAD